MNVLLDCFVLYDELTLLVIKWSDDETYDKTHVHARAENLRSFQLLSEIVQFGVILHLE